MEKKRLIGCGLGAILVILGILPPMLGNLQVWDIIITAIGVGTIAIALNQGKRKKEDKKMEKLEKMLAKIMVIFGLGIFVWAGVEWYSNPLCHNPGFSLLLMLGGVPFCAGLIVGGPKVLAWLTGWAVSSMIAISIFALIATFVPIFKAIKTTPWLVMTIFLGYLLISGIAAGLVAIHGDEFIAKIENRAERFGLFLQ